MPLNRLAYQDDSDAWLWFLQSRWFVDTEEERLMITLTGSEFLKWRSRL